MRALRLRAGLITVGAGLLAAYLVLVFSASPARSESVRVVEPALALPRVVGDADDCAIWIHPSDGSKSLVIGNDKSGSKRGIYVYDLQGKVLQFVAMERPSNVDVRYGMALGGRSVDICAVVERNRNQLRVFTIDPATRRLTEVSAPKGISTHIEGQTYGLALYKRPSDGVIFAFASAKSRGGDLRQIQLRDNGSGKVKGVFVRAFGHSDIKTYVEGMVADDELGFLYACDERHAVLKFEADPVRGDKLVQKFAVRDGVRGDREGIAIYHCPDRTGYVLLSSQGNSTVKVYARQGDNRFITTIDTVGAHDTDGLDITSCAAGPMFPKGFLVCHDTRGRRYVLYRWEDVAGTGLKVVPGYNPRNSAGTSK